MNKIGFSGIVITCGILTGIFAQSNRKQQDYLQWYAQAQRLYDLEEPTETTDSAALQLFHRAADYAIQYKDYRKAIESYIKAGNIHQTYQHYNESNRNYHVSLSINNAHLKDDHLIYEAYLYMGSSHYFSNIIDSAQYYFEKASAIALTYNTENLPEEERLYNSLGAIYFESANYQQAKNYFEKALLLSKSGTSDYEESFVGINSNIANCLLRLHQYDSALRIYMSLSKYDMKKEVSEVIRQNTAHTYFEMGHYDSALVIYKTLSSQNVVNRIKALNDIGRIYMHRQQWQQSEAIFDSAIAVNKSIATTVKNKEEALAYLYRGQLAARQGLTDEAITWCNEALREVHLDFKWHAEIDLPEDVMQTVSPLTLFEILRTKAGLLYKKYLVSKQKELLFASVLTFRKAIETANFIKVSFDNDEAKLFFNESYQSIYKESMTAVYNKYLITNKAVDDYIFIAENYKGSILHQNLQNIILKSTAQVPDSIRRREKDIRQLLAFYTSRINNNAAENDAQQLQKKLLELHIELSRLQRQYEKDETYNLYKYQPAHNTLTTKKIQASIDDQTALINFYMTETDIYLLAMNKTGKKLLKIKQDSALSSAIDFFLKEIYQHTEGQRYEGSASSAAVYRYLLEPASDIISKKEKWIVIPDNILYYVPVEALMRDEQGRKYLVEDYTVSYHYSFMLLFQQNTHHRSEGGSRKAGGFAPYAVKDDNITRSQFSELPYSKNEINSFAATAYLSSEATKQKFIETITAYPFIHLATHASAGSDTSTNWIQFYPADSSELNNKLFLHEIYNLDLHRAELVILSACETAGGSTASGEGLLSLSRAFLYAGADGIISTLWKSEDQVTAFLMQRLHTYIEQGIAPEKSLQLAKKDLLNEKTIGSQYKTPNYWSNFIYVGKVTIVNESKFNNWWWIIFAVAGVLSFVLIKKFRQRRNLHDFNLG